MIKAGNFFLIALFSIIFLLVVIEDEIRKYETIDASFSKVTNDGNTKDKLIKDNGYGSNDLNDELNYNSDNVYYVTGQDYDSIIVK